MDTKEAERLENNFVYNLLPEERRTYWLLVHARAELAGAADEAKLQRLRASHQQLDEACGKIHEICSAAGIAPGHVADRVQALKTAHDALLGRLSAVVPGACCPKCHHPGISGYDKPDCKCPKCGSSVFIGNNIASGYSG